MLNKALNRKHDVILAAINDILGSKELNYELCLVEEKGEEDQAVHPQYERMYDTICLIENIYEYMLGFSPNFNTKN